MVVWPRDDATFSAAANEGEDDGDGVEMEGTFGERFGDTVAFALFGVGGGGASMDCPPGSASESTTSAFEGVGNGGGLLGATHWLGYGEVEGIGSKFDTSGWAVVCGIGGTILDASCSFGDEEEGGRREAFDSSEPDEAPGNGEASAGGGSGLRLGRASPIANMASSAASCPWLLLGV